MCMPKCKQIALNFKFSKKNYVDKQIWNNFFFYWNLNTKQKPAKCQALKVNSKNILTEKTFCSFHFLNLLLIT